MTPAHIDPLLAEQARLEPRLAALLGTVVRWAGLSLPEPLADPVGEEIAPAGPDAAGDLSDPPAGWVPGLPAPRSAENPFRTSPPSAKPAPSQRPAPPPPQDGRPGPAIPPQTPIAANPQPLSSRETSTPKEPAFPAHETQGISTRPEWPARTSAPLAQLRRIAERGDQSPLPPRQTAVLSVAASLDGPPRPATQTAPDRTAAFTTHEAPAQSPAAKWPATPSTPPTLPQTATPRPEPPQTSGFQPAPPANTPLRPTFAPPQAAPAPPAARPLADPARPDPFARSQLEEDMADALERAAREAGIDLS